MSGLSFIHEIEASISSEYKARGASLCESAASVASELYKKIESGEAFADEEQRNDMAVLLAGLRSLGDKNIRGALPDMETDDKLYQFLIDLGEKDEKKFGENGEMSAMERLRDIGSLAKTFINEYIEMMTKAATTPPDEAAKKKLEAHIGKIRDFYEQITGRLKLAVAKEKEASEQKPAEPAATDSAAAEPTAAKAAEPKDDTSTVAGFGQALPASA